MTLFFYVFISNLNLLQMKWDSVPFPPYLKGHQTSPFIWIERANASDPSLVDVAQLLGPSEKLAEWALEQPKLAANAEIKKAAGRSYWDQATEIFEAPTSTADVSK